MRFVTLLQVVLRRWWLFPPFVALGLAGAHVWYTSLPPRYESSVTLQINPAARSSLLPYSPDGRGEVSSVTALAASYAEVLRSRAFGELVVRELDLAATPAAIGGSVGARLIPNTNILRLTVTWDNPPDAERLAQGIAEVFLRRQQAEPGGQSRLAEIEATLRSYRARIEALRPQREQLDRAVAEGELSRIPELNNLEARLATLESTHANLLVESNRARSAIDTASILDSAAPARVVRAWTLERALAVGLLAGVAVAVALAFFLQELDDRVRTPEDIVAVAGSAPIATVGRIGTRGWPKGARRSRLVALHGPRSAAAEAFRSLRTNLRLAASERPIRSVLVNSPEPSEGKTLVASNLAIMLAQAGQRVLLVDADLRRPSLHDSFGLQNQTGLADLLIRPGPGVRAGLQAAAPGWHGPEQEIAGVVPSGVPNLSILPAGQVPADPSDLLGGDGTARLLASLSSRWDVVVVDSAPIGPVADTLLLARHADAVLVVARAGQTRRSALESTLEALRQAGRPAAGVVLNDLRLGPLDRYTSYAYYTQAGQYYGRTNGVAGERTRGHPATAAPAPPNGPPPGVGV